MTGLIGWWPLHEDSGDKAYDLSGNENHGSLNGGVTQGVAGKGGLTAYSFDGSDDYVNHDKSPVSGGQSEITVSLWFRLSQGGSEQYMYESTGGPNDWSYASRLGAGDNLQTFIETDTTYSLNTNFTVSEDRWYHLVVKLQSEVLRIYVDGEQIDSLSDITGTLEDTTGFHIGSSRTPDRNWNGSICNVRIYDRALSVEEIQTLYDWGSGDFARPLNNENSSSAVSRWALDGDATDSWGSNDGTTSGGLSWSNDAIRGQAASFDGSDDEIDVGNSLGGASEGTVAAWVQSHTDTGWKAVWDENDGTSANGTRLYLTNNNVFGFQVNGKWAESDVTPVSNSWYFIVGTYDGSNVKMYINGYQKSATSQSGIIESTSEGMIGSEYDGDYTWDGKIDEVRIYDKALSREEVFELYRWGTKGRDMRKFTVNSRGL